MTFQVRLYMHHDNDLIQLHLNGVRLCDVFAKSLEAHYKKEQIRFALPENMEFKPHKGKVYRIKVTLDDKKHGDLVKWVCAFPDQYKCHCIKNIARSYLGTAVIDTLNGMAGSGAWAPDNRDQNGVRTMPLKRWAKRTDQKDKEMQWIDQVSASREKTEEQIRRAEEGRKRIRNLPVETILGRQPDDMDAGAAAQSKKSPQVARTAGTSGAAKAVTATAPAPHMDPAPAEPVQAESVAPALLEPTAIQNADTSEGAGGMDMPHEGEDVFLDTEYGADDAKGEDFDALTAFDQLRFQ